MRPTPRFIKVVELYSLLTIRYSPYFVLETSMMFMVIEKFRDQDAKAIYARLRDKGRQLPDGLRFVNSWVSADLGRCFQLMEADDVALFQRWIAEWTDLMEFEVVPVVQSRETAIALGAAI